MAGAFIISGVAVWAAVSVSCVPFTKAPLTATLLYREEPDVKVRIRASIEGTQISGPTSMVCRPAAGGTPQVLAGPLAVAASPAGIRLSGSDGRSYTWGPGAAVEVFSVDASEAAGRTVASRRPRLASHLHVDGADYPGFILLWPRSDEGSTKLDVIVAMGIEEYLPGVVAKEMLPRWPAAAYEVQAIAARTYALHERERSRRLGKPFDLENSTLDQVYGGETKNLTVLDACRDTRGIALTWRGQMLRAYYSSTCGGRAAAAKDVWPIGKGFEFNLAGPLQGGKREVTCADSPWSKIEVKRTVDDLSQRVRAWGKIAGHPVKTFGTIAAVVPETLNGNGRPSRFIVTDSTGRRAFIGAEELRVACNTPAEGLKPIAKATRVTSGDLDFAFSGSSVTITCRGFGHGVGMCQWCARSMADRGDDWKTMLGRFYPGSIPEVAYP